MLFTIAIQINSSGWFTGGLLNMAMNLWELLD
jgi:hypothetical protein